MNNKTLAKIIRVLCIFSLVLLVPFVICGCDSGGNSDPQYGNYSVTVVDEVGSPVSNVIVKFIDSDGQSKTKVTDKDGKAGITDVLLADYTVKVEAGFSDAEILTNEFKLTKDIRDLKIRVRNTSKLMEIYGVVADGAKAYVIGDGEYDISSVANETAYHVFYAPTKGTYKVSFTSTDADMTVGFYGIPMFVQDYHVGDGAYDGKTFELVIQDTATPYIIGISCKNTTETTLKIERTGDVPFDPAYAPWTSVPSTATLEKLTLPAGATLKDVDITDPSLTVSLGDDGYYYTSDGKLVYLRLNSLTDARYLDVSLAFIAGLVDENHGQNFGGYVYDENGEFVAKYSYNDMLETYMEYCDQGVYPLTEELAVAMKLQGESIGWWNPNAANYLFSSVLAVKENAWLFACCTVEN